VKRFTILADPDGKWVFPDSDEFLALLDDPDPDYAAVAFAVINLGFIQLEILPQSFMEIEVHPRNVGFRAVQAVEEQLGVYRLRFLGHQIEPYAATAAV
jgi:hypothetical protein